MAAQRAAMLLLLLLGRAVGITSPALPARPASRPRPLVQPLLPEPPIVQPRVSLPRFTLPHTLGEPASRSRALLAACAASYGTNYALIKLLDGWAGSPATGAALRFSVAAAALLPALLVLGHEEPRLLSWPLARSGVEVGCWFACGYAVQAVALETSGAGMQAFLLSLAVVVCPVLECFVLGRSQPPRALLAAALAMAGVGTLECTGAHGISSQGDLLGLLQPLFFGTGFFRLER